MQRTLFTDQTGKFPQTSILGNKYQMILHKIDSNSTWVDPMKNRTKCEIIAASKKALKKNPAICLKRKHQILGNKTSAKYKGAIQASGMTYQLVPPDDHRRNIFNKAIQFWKDHFIAVLSGTANNFSLHLWCQVIPQAERQLLFYVNQITTKT